MPEEPKHPVVVTFREAEEVLTGQEAVSNLQEAADEDTGVTPEGKAAILAAMGNVLNALRRSEKEAGARVLNTPQDDRAARLQSLIASGEAANLKFAPLETGGLEAKFDTLDWFGWARGRMGEAETSVPARNAAAEWQHAGEAGG